VGICCHRRITSSMQLQPRPLKAFFHASFRALSAAARSVGAAGGGWALVAATRAATATSSAKDESQEREAVLGDGPVPRHIAVIMDGNRRYGKREYGNTLQGHRSGGEKLRDFMEWCVEAGVDALTVFAFSTENWKRDPQEVDAMMQLFVTEVPQLEEKTVKLNVRVHFLCSDSQRIPPCAEGDQKPRRTNIWMHWSPTQHMPQLWWPQRCSVRLPTDSPRCCSRKT